MITMHYILSDVSVEVLGKQVADPKLQLISSLAGLLVLAGMAGIAITKQMVDEKKVRAEQNISSLFALGMPPRRILTDTGRKIRGIAYFSAGLGVIMLIAVFLLCG
jgi:hypothetical protein